MMNDCYLNGLNRHEREIGQCIGIFDMKKRVAPLNDWPKNLLLQSNSNSRGTLLSSASKLRSLVKTEMG